MIITTLLSGPVKLFYFVCCLDQHFSHRPGLINAELQATQAGYCEHHMVFFREYPDVSLGAVIDYSLAVSLGLDCVRVSWRCGHLLVLSPGFVPFVWRSSSDAHTISPIDQIANKHHAYALFTGP
jgi:hypothetical protein